LISRSVIAFSHGWQAGRFVPILKRLSRCEDYAWSLSRGQCGLANRIEYLSIRDHETIRIRNIGAARAFAPRAAPTGLDRAAAAVALHDPRYEEEVAQEVQYWEMQNITGVPAFIINGKYMIPGAQDAETFVRVIEKVLEKEAA
jgi:TATA-box binding protein (TBP) (component of TFIID and TFIIIB)